MHTLYLFLCLAFFVTATHAQHWQLGSHERGITSITFVSRTSQFVTIGNEAVLHSWDQRTGHPIATLPLADTHQIVGSYFTPILHARADSALIYVITPARITCTSDDLTSIAWTLDLEQGTFQDAGLTMVVTDTVIYQDQITATVLFDVRTGIRTLIPVGGIPQSALASCIRVEADSIFRVRYDDGVILDTLVMSKRIQAFDVSHDGMLIAVATDERTYVVAGDSLHVVDSISISNYFGEKVLLSPSGGRVLNARGIMWDRTRKIKYSFDNDDNAASSDLLTHSAWSKDESIISGVAKSPCSNGMACKGGWMTIFNAGNGAILAHPIGTVGKAFDAAVTDDGLYAVLGSTGLVSIRRIVDGQVRLNRWPIATEIRGGATSPTAQYGMYEQFDADTGGIDPLTMTTLLASSPSQAAIAFSVPVTEPVSPTFVTDRMTFTTNATYIVDVLNGGLRVVNVSTGAQSDLSVQARFITRCTGSLIASVTGRSTVSVIDCASLQEVGGFSLEDSVTSVASVRGTQWIVASTETQRFVYDLASKKMIDTVDVGVDDVGRRLFSKHFIAKTGTYVSTHSISEGVHEIIATRLRDGVIIRRGDTVATDVADMSVSPNGYAVVVVATDGRVTTTRGFTDIDTIVVDTSTTSVNEQTTSPDAIVAIAHEVLTVRSTNANAVRVDVVDVLGNIVHTALSQEHVVHLAAFPHQALYVRVIGRTRSWTHAIITP